MVLASPIFTLTSKCLWFDLELELLVVVVVVVVIVVEVVLPERKHLTIWMFDLGWRIEWICSGRPITICPIVRWWTHARCTSFGISTRSRGNKDQSGLSHWLHYRETLSPPSAGDAQSTNVGLLAANSWHWLRLACSGWLTGFESTCVWSSEVRWRTCCTKHPGVWFQFEL